MGTFRPDFTQIAVVPVFPAGGWSDLAPIASDFATTFYVAKGDQVRSFLADGTVGPTTWTLPITLNLGRMAVSTDNTTLYYGDTTSGAQKIQRWNLLTDKRPPHARDAPRWPHGWTRISSCCPGRIV